MYTNHLISEKSPYLLQHVHNPVDWYPWGEEAFEKAKKEDKPIFLSIGYSTCHWCHVMEKESFSDPEIAKTLNENFVSIKVDREERPDIDNIYMSAVVSITGSGGWPLTVFLTPEKEPFYGGTYFPPDDKWGRSGLKNLLLSVAQDWKERRIEILNRKDAVIHRIRAQSRPVGEIKPLAGETLKDAYVHLSRNFDPDHGGLGDAPKFPMAHSISFLMRYWKRTGESKPLEMAEKTLSKIFEGGIHDYIGGGFHRYSTDQRWHLPHFEKMLYDQAMLSRAYLEAYQATGKEEYAKAAKDIFEYVLHDMRNTEGAFYSAEDADSPAEASRPDEKEEGAFYVWTKEDIIDVLGSENGEIFCYRFGIESGGNVLQDPLGAFPEKNVLYIARSLDDIARRFNKSKPEIDKILEESRAKLLAERNKRPRPHLDDKILTDWNSLMISSLAFGGRVLDEPEYTDAAKKAADFILANLMDKNGRLLHRWREGEAAINGMLDDYAFLINGLIDLYEATFDLKYLEYAVKLTRQMLDFFWDEKEGGFFFTADGSEKLIIRHKDVYDGAIPSGNSFAALDLIRLSKITTEGSFDKKLEELLNAFSGAIRQMPSGYFQTLISLDFVLGPSREIVIVGEEDSEDTKNMIRMIYKKYIPNKVVIFRPTEKVKAEKATSIIPDLKDWPQENNKTTVYVCTDYVCDLPVTSLEELENVLEK